ncbi:hypothetical protein WJX77_009057 [Trebouxia sp. C0004]
MVDWLSKLEQLDIPDGAVPGLYCWPAHRRSEDIMHASARLPIRYGTKSKMLISGLVLALLCQRPGLAQGHSEDRTFA